MGFAKYLGWFASRSATLVLFHSAVYVFILGVPKTKPDLEKSVSPTKPDPPLVRFEFPKFCL